MNVQELTHESLSFCYDQLNESDYKNWFSRSINSGFPYEYFYYKNKHLYRPWEDFSLISEQMSEEWKTIVQQLEVVFSNREKDQIKPYMQKGITLYLSLLFWSNQLPVNLVGFPANLKDIKGKPVNVEERLVFILSRPYFYPSYMQLKSLMEEQFKIVAKMQALKKYSK